MKKDLRQKLEEKGWEKGYIERAVKILEGEQEKDGKISRKLDRIVYWVAMIVAIVGNFIISIILIPFLVTITNRLALGIIIFAISVCFGLLFNILLRDIEEIDYEHHLIAGIFLPALALINIFVITNVANHFITLFSIQSPHNPITVSIIYIASFMTPYLLDKFLRSKSEEKS